MCLDIKGGAPLMEMQCALSLHFLSPLFLLLTLILLRQFLYCVTCHFVNRVTLSNSKKPCNSVSIWSDSNYTNHTTFMSIYLDNHFNYNNERVIDRNKKQLKKNAKSIYSYEKTRCRSNLSRHEKKKR